MITLSYIINGAFQLIFQVISVRILELFEISVLNRTFFAISVIALLFSGFSFSIVKNEIDYDASKARGYTYLIILPLSIFMIIYFKDITDNIGYLIVFILGNLLFIFMNVSIQGIQQSNKSLKQMINFNLALSMIKLSTLLFVDTLDLDISFFLMFQLLINIIYVTVYARCKQINLPRLKLFNMKVVLKDSTTSILIFSILNIEIWIFSNLFSQNFHGEIIAGLILYKVVQQIVVLFQWYNFPDMKNETLNPKFFKVASLLYPLVTSISFVLSMYIMSKVFPQKIDLIEISNYSMIFSGIILVVMSSIAFMTQTAYLYKQVFSNYVLILGVSIIYSVSLTKFTTEIKLTIITVISFLVYTYSLYNFKKFLLRKYEIF